MWHQTIFIVFIFFPTTKIHNIILFATPQGTLYILQVTVQKHAYTLPSEVSIWSPVQLRFSHSLYGYWWSLLELSSEEIKLNCSLHLLHFQVTYSNNEYTENKCVLVMKCGVMTKISYTAGVQSDSRSSQIKLNWENEKLMEKARGRVKGYRNINTIFFVYRVSHEEWIKLRESVPYVKIHRYNPKHLYRKLNGYGDNGQRSLKLWQLLLTYWLPNTF